MNKIIAFFGGRFSSLATVAIRSKCILFWASEPKLPQSLKNEIEK